ncbi:glycosyltransferase family 2 protein, partial [Candidatus Bathyarchaeota archaeon]|nr:glycosyltransferase family 2 protein [Candidatus Bathyarchaeota archaeon]
MKFKFTKNSRILYLVFCIPFFLTILVWIYLPVLAQWIINNVFGYEMIELATNPFWLFMVRFFFAWYTFVAVGLAGVWVIAATLARKEKAGSKCSFYPSVSLVVPAYNQEANIARCITSLFKCAQKYDGPCEILIVDDGSEDYTYEASWSAIELNRRENPRTHSKVIRHSVNLGKIECLRTGTNRALGRLVAIVDADSEWMPETLVTLVDFKLSNGKKAITGFVGPLEEEGDRSLYSAFQKLEYGQGVAIGRCAQSLGNNVLVVSGAIGLYDSTLLREILTEKSIRSVTEDLEITLEIHKKGGKVGYVSLASSFTLVPTSFSRLWSQRLRWFTGWLHNT